MKKEEKTSDRFENKILIFFYAAFEISYSLKGSFTETSKGSEMLQNKLRIALSLL